MLLRDSKSRLWPVRPSSLWICFWSTSQHWCGLDCQGNHLKKSNPERGLHALLGESLTGPRLESRDTDVGQRKSVLWRKSLWRRKGWHANEPSGDRVLQWFALLCDKNYASGANGSLVMWTPGGKGYKCMVVPVIWLDITPGNVAWRRQRRGNYQTYQSLNIPPLLWNGPK